MKILVNLFEHGIIRGHKIRIELKEVFQINGIHNSIEKKKSVEPCGEAKAVEEEGEYVPKLVEEEEEEEVVLKRTNPPLLKLELKKSYEFNPGLWTAR